MMYSEAYGMNIKYHIFIFGYIQPRMSLCLVVVEISVVTTEEVLEVGDDATVTMITIRTSSVATKICLKHGGHVNDGVERRIVKEFS